MWVKLRVVLLLLWAKVKILIFRRWVTRYRTRSVVLKLQSFSCCGLLVT